MATPLTKSRPVVIALAIVTLIGVAVAAYAPGLGGVFVFDSIERVIRNDSLQISALDVEQLLGAAYAAQDSYPQRGLAYITLALNYYFAGQQFAPFAFKATNLAIHILNGLLVFMLARLILSRWRQPGVLAGRHDPSARIAVLAVFAMGLWLLHPIQLTSVLYVVQRMTSIAATWVLAGSIAYIYARARFQQGRRPALALMYLGVVVFAGIGLLSKESALLLPAFVAVLELFLFDRSSLAAEQKRGLAWYFGVILLTPLLAGVAALALTPELFLAGYDGRDFDLLQRLLTQARVLFLYLGLLLIPDIRRFGLYHDDVVTSAGLFDPVSTFFAVIAWVAIVVVVAWGARGRAPWAFAVAWFLVGHAMESTIVPLEQVHEHRNYLPGIGLVVAAAYYAGILWERAGRLRMVVVSVSVIWLLVLALVSHMRADTWRNPALMMETLARHHPQSYRSVVGYAFNSIPVRVDLSVRFDAFKRAALLDDRVVVPLIEMAKIASAVGEFLGGGELKSRNPGSEGCTMPIRRMQLLADGEHNACLLEALDHEIGARLSSKLARTDSIVILVSLVDCALEGNRECMALRGDVRRWHESALSNERLPVIHRAALELSVAKIHASVGDHEAAVGHAHRASELVADNLAYRLQEATLYALLARWSELGLLLGEIETRFPDRANADPAFRKLKSQFGNATSQ